MNGNAASEKRNIVVVGGSYVGLKAVEFLTAAFHNSHKVVLVEKNSHFHHLFAFPRFAVLPGYEHLAFIPYTNAFHGCPPDSARLVHGRVTAVRPGKVEYEDVLDPSSSEPKSIEYDYLVVATGTYMPSISGKKEGIESMRQRQEMVKHAGKIAVIGGGAVGVQTATDIKDLYPAKSVTLIHSRDRLMNAFHPRMHELIMERCKELGIDVVLGDRVKIPAEGFSNDGREFEIVLSSGRKVTADLAVVSTGQRPVAAFLETLSPHALSPKTGGVAVKPTLQLADPAHPNVFAVGDVAEHGGPKQARPGFRQAQIVTENMQKLEKARQEGREVKEEELETYTPDPAGIHLSLGIKRNVIFRNPPTPEGEPQYEMKDDGEETVNAAKVWAMRAPGITDYHL